MPGLLHWYITKNPIGKIKKTALKEAEYLGQEDYYYYTAHGNVEGNPMFPDGTRIHTSPIKHIEWIPEKKLLRVHTVRSIYDCATNDFRQSRQAPLDILPKPIREAAFSRFRSGIAELPVKNSILLTFDNNDERYNFVYAAVNRNGHISDLNIFVHTGFSSDSILIYDGEDIGLGGIDICYFTAASREEKYIEFYSFFTDDLPVYLQNAGEPSLTFLTSSGLIEISPGYQLMIT